MNNGYRFPVIETHAIPTIPTTAQVKLAENEQWNEHYNHQRSLIRKRHKNFNRLMNTINDRVLPGGRGCGGGDRSLRNRGGREEGHTLQCRLQDNI